MKNSIYTAKNKSLYKVTMSTGVTKPVYARNPLEAAQIAKYCYFGVTKLVVKA